MTCPEFVRRRRIYRRIFGRINSLQYFGFAQRCIKSTILYLFVQRALVLTAENAKLAGRLLVFLTDGLVGKLF
jgi:hypothetical protein